MDYGGNKRFDLDDRFSEKLKPTLLVFEPKKLVI